MKQRSAILNLVVAAILTFTSTVSPGLAQVPSEQDLLGELAQPDQPHWQRIERQILQRWGTSGSEAIDYVFQRGEVALQAGDAQAAIEHFSAVIDQAPDFAEAWNGRATAFFLANRLGESLADIERVLILNPHHFGALAGLGMIMEQLDRPDRARAAYEAAMAINPHQQAVIDGLARLDLASQGEAL